MSCARTAGSTRSTSPVSCERNDAPYCATAIRAARSSAVSPASPKTRPRRRRESARRPSGERPHVVHSRLPASFEQRRSKPPRSSSLSESSERPGYSSRPTSATSSRGIRSPAMRARNIDGECGGSRSERERLRPRYVPASDGRGRRSSVTRRSAARASRRECRRRRARRAASTRRRAVSSLKLKTSLSSTSDVHASRASRSTRAGRTRRRARRIALRSGRRRRLERRGVGRRSAPLDDFAFELVRRGSSSGRPAALRPAAVSTALSCGSSSAFVRRRRRFGFGCSPAVGSVSVDGSTSSSSSTAPRPPIASAKMSRASSAVARAASILARVALASSLCRQDRRGARRHRPRDARLCVEFSPPAGNRHARRRRIFDP